MTIERQIRMMPDDGAGDGGTAVTGDSGAPAGDTGNAESGAGVSGGTGYDWNTVITPELQEKEYFKNILKSENPGAELVKQFDNVQQLIGKRPAGIPGDDASEEDIVKFYETIRPKVADDYDIKPLDVTAENKEVVEYINSTLDEDSVKSAKQLAFESGIPKKAFDKFVSGWLQKQAAEGGTKYAEAIEQQKAQADWQKGQEAGFDELFKQFGGDKAAAEEYGKRAIAEHCPDFLKVKSHERSNESLAMIAAIAKSMHDKYEKPDSFNPNGATTGSGTYESLKAKLDEAMSNPRYFESNVVPGHDDWMEQNVHVITKQMAALSQKK